MLPDTPGAREDFEWLKDGVERRRRRGERLRRRQRRCVVGRRARRGVQAVAAGCVPALAQDWNAHSSGRSGVAGPASGARPAVRRLLDIFRERMTAIESTDFFGSAGRDRVVALLGQLEDRASERLADPGGQRRRRLPRMSRPTRGDCGSPVRGRVSIEWLPHG